ncbi:glycerol-3-phosphate 1-O-acyltransferase PlsY [Candidatus Omnitrophota bacterium]
MSEALKVLLLSLGAYLFGAIPFGLFIGKKIKGVDVRNFGSGNIGATNVVRVIGRKWGILVFTLDFFKGFAPVCVTFIVMRSDPDLLRLACLIVTLAAIAGHNWPVYLKFKGGKGVSTTIGCAAALSIFLPVLRMPLLGALLVWVITYKLSKLVGLASLLMAFAFLLVCFLAPGTGWEFKTLALFIALFITIRHRQNIKDIRTRFKR